MAHWLHTRFFARAFRPIDGLPGPAAYFDWSFYDQGTVPAEDSSAARVGSVGSFFERALVHFGDPDPNRPGQGERLAGLVQARRTLFVIDGLEPLQAPPGSARPGGLLDPDLETFIRALLQRNPGLLVITSRQALPDLEGTAALCDQRDLHELARASAIRLLRQFQVTGTEDALAAACERFSCHALSLTLLGRFLFDAHGGDIRCIDQIDLHSADRATPDRHRTAWKVLAAYENWLCPPQSARAPAPRPAGGWAWSAAGRTWRRIAGALRGRRDPQAAEPARARRRTLAMLRLTGLFDRPASPDCLAALRAAPPIRGLTDALTGLDEDGWRTLLRGQGLHRAHPARHRDRRLLQPEQTRRDRRRPGRGGGLLRRALGARLAQPRRAQRGPMPLFEADVLLYRARLGVGASRPSSGDAAAMPERGQDAPAPSSPQADLAAARRLIEHHGYGRRLPELEDAEAALQVATADWGTPNADQAGSSLKRRGRSSALPSGSSGPRLGGGSDLQIHP